MSHAGDLARMLAERAPDLARDLLPLGCRHGSEWRVGSLAGEKGKSLSVHLHGPRAGVWADFSSSDRGDALDLVAAVLFAGDRRSAMEWSRRWLGLGDGAVPAELRRTAPAPSPGNDADADKLRSKALALRLFLEAKPSLAGTPAESYLAGRGIDFRELGRQPRSLRYHPALFNTESRRTWPALVAAITDAAGDMTAIHRHWLARDAGGRWGKAPLDDAKMSLGLVKGGTIRLWRGASGRPLSKAAPDEAVVIAEGIETGLSIAVACPELRVLASVSLGNLWFVALPPAIRTVIVAADNDKKPGAIAELRRAVARLVGSGLAVRIARSPVGKDFNDVLKAESI